MSKVRFTTQNIRVIISNLCHIHSAAKNIISLWHSISQKWSKKNTFAWLQRTSLCSNGYGLRGCNGAGRCTGAPDEDVLLHNRSYLSAIRSSRGEERRRWDRAGNYRKNNFLLINSKRFEICIALSSCAMRAQEKTTAITIIPHSTVAFNSCCLVQKFCKLCDATHNLGGACIICPLSSYHSRNARRAAA